MSHELKLAFCSQKAAAHAVTRWHYSKRMPVGPLVKIGVWEGDSFRGVVIFGRGAAPHLGKKYGFKNVNSCELVRIALRSHKAPVSRIVRVALIVLRKQCPGLKTVFSFADPGEGHVGGIYQAGGWVYTGETNPAKFYYHEGRWKHPREATGGSFSGLPKISVAELKTLPVKVKVGKHRYIIGLDSATTKHLESFRVPYPKRASPIGGSPDQGEKGGAGPTLALDVEPDDAT